MSRLVKSLPIEEVRFSAVRRALHESDVVRVAGQDRVVYCDIEEIAPRRYEVQTKKLRRNQLIASERDEIIERGIYDGLAAALREVRDQLNA